jgi:DNA-binding transcriptional ArsR family regulator
MEKTLNIDPEKLEKAATMLKAMAHPMRVAILNLLNSNEKLTVSEIHLSLGIEQSTTSHHLGILKDKGVLRSERSGKNSYYFLKNKNLEHIIECLNKCADCD